MKVDARELVRAAAPIHAIADPKAPGAYSMVRLLCSGEYLFLIGGKPGTSIQTFVNVSDPDTDMDVAVVEKDLFNSIQHLEGEVTISKSGNRRKFSAGGIKFNMQTSSTEYGIQKIDWDRDGETLFISSDELRSALAQTLFCVGRTRTSNVTDGLQINMRGGELMFCGSDNFSLGVSTLQIPHPFPDFDTIVLPTKPTQILEREAGRGQMFQIQLVKSSGADAGPTSIIAFIGNMMMRTSILDQTPADFVPLLDNVISRDHTNVNIGRDDLVKALKAAETAASKAGSIAWFRFADNELVIQVSASSIGVITARVPCDYNGEVIDIGMDPKRLCRCVSRMAREVVTLEVPESVDDPISISEENVRYIIGTSYIDNISFEEDE